jgi:predicted GNAT superfamily acetyltransferase
VRADRDHVQAIAAIAAAWRLTNRPESDLRRRGFLVSDLDARSYEQIVQQSDQCFVGLRQGQVVGFVIGYGSERIVLDNDACTQALQGKLDTFSVVKQIAVHPQSEGGVGTVLYEQLFKNTRGRILAIAVVDSPRNDRSHTFHRRLGFSPTFRFKHSDGRLRTVLVRQEDATKLVSSERA